MPTQLNPYLTFRDQARPAMVFYQSVLGGVLTLQTFGEFHAAQDPSENEKIMHSQLKTDNGLVLMASDTPNAVEYQPGNSVSLSLTGDEEAELRGYFEKLAAGGTVLMPLQQAGWGDAFGMCIDQFGMRWLVNIAAKQP